MKKTQQENREFGSRIRRFRNDIGLSANEVAAHLGIAVSTYREWENGRAVTGQPYLKLAGIFRKNVSELFGLDQNRVQESTLRSLEAIEKAVREIRSCL